MKTEAFITRKSTHWGTLLLLGLLLAHVLLPALAWLGKASGQPWGNPFSGEGIRWYFLHVAESFHSPLMAVVVPIVLLVGALERSGLSDAGRVWWEKGARSLTYRQRTACLVSGIFFLCYAAGLLLLLCGPHAILRSVTGEVYPSPFVSGILQNAVVGVVLSSLIYATLSNHLRGWRESLSVLYWGIHSYAVWLFDAVLSSHLYSVAVYVWGGMSGYDFF